MRTPSRVYISAAPRYPVGMDRLTTDQARKIHGALGPATGYLWRLVERMPADARALR
jgi:hypothetical protein